LFLMSIFLTANPTIDTTTNSGGRQWKERRKSEKENRCTALSNHSSLLRKMKQLKKMQLFVWKKNHLQANPFWTLFFFTSKAQ
jgi:hypothetical protein